MPTANQSPVCRVYDMNAKLADRVHDIAGTQYQLSAHGEGTEVPLADAVQFLRDPSFVVLDRKGKKMEMKAPPKSRADIKLPVHQTIANLDELSIPALVTRVKMLPGSDGFTKNTGRKKLVQFIMAGGIEEPIETSELDDETASLIAGEEDEDDVADDDGDTGVADKALEGESFPDV